VNDLPAQDRLARVVGSLARHLPGQLGILLAAARFDEGRAALERLGATGGEARAVAGIRPSEAARLANLLLDRWAAVAEVVIEPGVVVIGPDEVWVAGLPRAVSYDLATIGVEDGWTAEWSGGSPVLEVPVPRGDEDVLLHLTVRVFGRVGGRREVLVGERAVRARRPVARLDPSGRLLSVSDHRGDPAVNVDVAVDGAAHRTDGRGVVQLEEPVRAEAEVLVDGQAVEWRP
jgi:hypothetical protein